MTYYLFLALVMGQVVSVPTYSMEQCEVIAQRIREITPEVVHVCVRTWN